MDQIPVSSSGGGGGGNSWPPALRRRLGLPSTTSCSSKSKSSNDEDSAHNIDITTTQSSSTHTESSTLSSHELRRYIHKTYSTLTSIQRQLHRGEESYFEQSYSHGNLLQGWDNIWIEQHNHHNHNSNSCTNSSGGMYSSSGMGEDGASSNNVLNNHAHHMNHNNNKSIPIRKMPAEYRWFTSSCGTNLPITSTDSIDGTSSGRVAALERWSLIDRPPTPEVQEEKQVANEEEVDSSLGLKKKNDANVFSVTSLTTESDKAEKDIGRNTNDKTTQSTKDTVAVKVESNMSSITNESHQVNGKETAHQSKKDEPTYSLSSSKVVTKAENQPIKNQPSKVADTKPQSYHVSSEQSSTDAELVIEKKTASSTLEFKAKKYETTNDTTSTRLRDASSLSSGGQSSTDAELVIEKKTTSSTLEFKAKKDETTNDTARLRDASNPSNIQSSSDAISSSSTAAADDDKDQTNTATVQSNKQIEITSSNGKNSTDITSSTMMDHPKNSIADKDSSEKTGHTTGGKGMTREQESSTSISLPQSKRARLDINRLSKEDDSTAADAASSGADMNTNLSNELVNDQETNKVQHLEPIEEEEEEKAAETIPISSTAVTDGSRASSSRRSTRKRKTTS